MLARETIEIRLDEGTGDLPGTIGAVVHEHHHVAILDAHRLFAGGHDGGGLDEFIPFVPAVGLLEALERALRLEFRLALGDQVIGRLDTGPAMVAVHGVVAADDGGDAAAAQFPELVLHEPQGGGGAAWRGVATIEKCVHIDLLRATPGGQLRHGVDMLLVAVHAAGRQQAEDMHGTTGVHRQVHGIGEGGIIEEGAGLDGTADAGELLVDHAPGTQIEMSHLRVAHLVAGQSDGGARGADQGMGILRPEAVPVGLACRGNGVEAGVFTVAPSIQNQQDHGLGGYRHGSLGGCQVQRKGLEQV